MAKRRTAAELSRTGGRQFVYGTSKDGFLQREYMNGDVVELRPNNPDDPDKDMSVLSMADKLSGFVAHQIAIYFRKADFLLSIKTNDWEIIPRFVWFKPWTFFTRMLKKAKVEKMKQYAKQIRRVYSNTNCSTIDSYIRESGHPFTEEVARPSEAEALELVQSQAKNK